MNEKQIPTWERLTAYFDGELSRDQRLEMEQLLFENPEYAKALQDWKELRSEMQVIPLQNLGTPERDSGARSRAVMDHIFESIAAGDVEWDTRPVDLDRYYKLQDSNLETKQPVTQWSKDFRTLHPVDRMRRWSWQLTAIASVAALLVLSLFLKRPEDRLLTGFVENQPNASSSIDLDDRLAEADLEGGSAVTRNDIDSTEIVSDSAIPSEVLATKSAGSFEPLAKNELAETKSANSGLVAAKSGQPTQNSLVTGEASQGAQPPANRFLPPNSLPSVSQPTNSQLANSRIPGSMDLGSPGVDSPTSKAKGGGNAGGRNIPGLPENSLPSSLPSIEQKGIVIFQIDDAEQGLSNLDSILVANGFGNLQSLVARKDSISESSSADKVLGDAVGNDEVDPVVAGLVPADRMELPAILLTGEVDSISTAVSEFRDEGNSIAFMSRLPNTSGMDTNRAIVDTATNPGAQFSRVLGQQVDLLMNFAPTAARSSVPVSQDLKSLFALDDVSVPKARRKPFSAVPSANLAQQSTDADTVQSRQTFQELQNTDSMVQETGQEVTGQSTSVDNGSGETKQIQVILLLQLRRQGDQ